MVTLEMQKSLSLGLGFSQRSMFGPGSILLVVQPGPFYLFSGEKTWEPGWGISVKSNQ